MSNNMGGGSGSSGTSKTVAKAAPTSVSEAKDFTELKTYLQSEYGIAVDASVENLNFELVQGSMSGIEEMLKRYPELKSSLKEITTSSTGLMCCSGGAVKFNPKDYSGSDAVSKYNNMIEQATKTKWFPANSSAKSIGIHETAHALVWYLTTRAVERGFSFATPEQKRRLSVSDWNNGKVAKDIVNQAKKNASKAKWGKDKKIVELANSVSGYAGYNKNTSSRAHEIIAESFADVLTNGDNASNFSKEVYKVTNEMYKS